MDQRRRWRGGEGNERETRGKPTSANADRGNMDQKNQDTMAFIIDSESLKVEAVTKKSGWNHHFLNLP
jgi:hypothetical protein